MGDMSAVVVSAEWRCTVPENGWVSSTATFSIPSGDNFTPYDQLTEEQILAWCWSSSVDRVAVEASISPQTSPSPEPVTPPLPWEVLLDDVQY
jgi:hypothetical protein